MSPNKMIKSMNIFNKYREGALCGDFFAAEHDILYTLCTNETIPEDSADGKELDVLGWHVDSGTDLWSYFT